MKKLLFFLLLGHALAVSNQAAGQCSGANVSVFQFQAVSLGSGTYTYSYKWKYNRGNASVTVVAKCGGLVVNESACNGNLRQTSGGNTTTIFDEIGTISFPDPSCPGVKELEIRVYSSVNCHGTFCPIGQNIPLPVEFSSFKATRNRSQVSLQWTTAMELNNTGFYVERNLGNNWEQLAFVPTQAAGGNSDQTLSYSFQDQNTVKGISQYRIRQVDADNQFRYSEIRSVRGEGMKGQTIVYPNPSYDGKVQVVFEEAGLTRDVVVADMSGRIVRQFRNVSQNNLQIDNLVPGMYSLRILVPATGEQTVEKLVVNR